MTEHDVPMIDIEELTDLDHVEEMENGKGWSLWLDADEQFDTKYMAIVLTDECQRL